jgi:ribonuclease HI
VLAIKEAIEDCPADIPLKIISDSKYAIEGLTKNLTKWEGEGFRTVSNGELIRLTATKVRERRAKTSLKWVKGHSGDAGNDGADELASEGARKEQPDIIDAVTRPDLNIPGAKLSVMTQSLAYKIIRQVKMNKDNYQDALDRNATRRNMEYAMGAAADEEGKAPPKRAMWRATRHKDFSRSIRFFMWMLLHGGYKVGRHWEHIPGHEEKGECSPCDAIESMEHILTSCEVWGQKQVWDLASELWQKKTGQDLRPTLGEIMACGLIKRGDKGTTRLFRIIVSESAHLIWRLRNERVIQEKNPASVQEIRNRWCRAINNRLTLDCMLTNVAKYAKKSIKKSLVKGTWCKVLKDEDYLPAEWTRETGVLVGVG